MPDFTFVAPVEPPPVEDDSCVSVVVGSFLADGATPDTDGILWTVEDVEGWWDTTAQRTGTLEQQPIGETISAPRENARQITLQVIASNPIAGTPLGSLLCFTAMDTIKATFAAVYVPVLFEVIDAVSDRTAYVRRVGPIKVEVIDQVIAVRARVPLLATNPRLVDV